MDSRESYSPATDVFSRKIAACHIVAIIALAFAVFSNGYIHTYNFDDGHLLLENQFVRSLRYIPRYFIDPLTLTSYHSNADYRPVLQISYALNYWISGYETWSWHLTQILLHLCVTVSLYLLCVEILRWKSKQEPMKAFWHAPLWIALFAAVHPTVSGVINYFSARSSLLVAAFLMPAFLIYLRRKSLRRAQATAVVLYTLALLTKVEAIAAVFVFFLIDVLHSPRSSEAERQFSADFKAALRSLHKTILPWLVGITIFYMVTRLLIVPQYTVLMRHNADITPYVYFCTQLTAWWFYVGKRIAPLNLVADNGTYPVFRHFSEPEVLLAAAGWLLVGVLVAKLWRRRPELAFFAIAALAMISPHSSISPLAEMVNDHRPYLPMMLLSVVPLTLFFESSEQLKIFNDRSFKWIVAIVLMGVAVNYARLTYARNLVFKSERSYYEDIVNKAPSARAYLNYGLTFLKAGDFEKAKKLFTQSVELAPNWFISQINLGIVEDVLGHGEAAMQHFDRAVGLEQYTTLAWQYRAAAWEKRQNSDAAIKDLRAAVARDPKDCVAIQKLGETLRRAKQPEDEVIAFNKLCE